RLNINSTWKFPVLIRDTLSLLRIPLIFGTVEFICSAELLATKKSIKVSKDKPPMVNVLDLIDGMSGEEAEILDSNDCAQIFDQFDFGMRARAAFDRLNEVSLVHDAMRRLEECVPLALRDNPDFAAIDKVCASAIQSLLTAFVTERGGDITNQVSLLIEEAVRLGLRKRTRDQIRNLPAMNLEYLSDETARGRALIHLLYARYAVCVELTT